MLDILEIKVVRIFMDFFDYSGTRLRSQVEGSRIPLLDSFCSSTNLGYCEILSAPVSHDQPPI